MKREASTSATGHGTPGDNIRAVRKSLRLTLSTVSERTGLAVSTLSKLEMGHISLSYDKLMALSRAFQVDMAQLLEAGPHAAPAQASGQGRRVIQRAGEGQLVETRSYKQLYMATELLHKQFIPIVVELRARTLGEFLEEFGALIRHPGEEYIYVLEGEVEFHSEFYAPARLSAGDSLYFDSEMGHAYLKGSDSVCRIVASCAHRGKDEPMIQTFMSASDRHAANSPPAETATTPTRTRRKK